jgi:hypothetical protein
MLCQYAHCLPTSIPNLECSPLLLTSKQMHQDSFQYSRPSLATTFIHIHCMLATISSLSVNRMNMLRYIGYNHTVKMIQSDTLKDQPRTLDLMCILESILSQNMLQTEHQDVMKFQNETHYMRLYITLIQRSDFDAMVVNGEQHNDGIKSGTEHGQIDASEVQKQS